MNKEVVVYIYNGTLYGYKTTKEIVVSNIFTFFNAMNLALAVLVATTLRFENMLFLGVIAINTAIGIFQEVRSKNALEKQQMQTTIFVQRCTNTSKRRHVTMLLINTWWWWDNKSIGNSNNKNSIQQC